MPLPRFSPLPSSNCHRLLPVPVLAGLAVAGTATLWGTSMAATKAALDDIQPLQLACLRFLVAGVLLSLLARRTGARPELGWRPAMLGLTGVALFIGIQNLGLQGARAADATIVMGGALPAAAAMLGLLFLGERLEPLKMLGLLCSLAGISLVGLTMQGNETSSLLGIVLLLVAAISGAVYATLGRRAYQARHLLPLLAGCSLYGALLLAPAALLETHLAGVPFLSPRSLALLFYLGAGCSALGFVLWAFGLRHLTALQNALICNLELPVGLLTAAFAGEQIQGHALAGGLLVVLGATLAVIRWRVPVAAAATWPVTSRDLHLPVTRADTLSARR
jgi:drug/metabolite transporter (DMT)-like permease